MGRAPLAPTTSDIRLWSTQASCLYRAGVAYNPWVHNRQSIRLRYRDYQLPGEYFVTLCTADRALVFGDVVDGIVQLSEIGRVANEEWLRSAKIRTEIELDAFVVMPNLFHAIVRLLSNTPRHHRLLPRQSNDGTPPRTLSDLMAAFKGATTRHANIIRDTPGLPFWQRGYHERVIRNDAERAGSSSTLPITRANGKPTRTTPPTSQSTV